MQDRVLELARRVRAVCLEKLATFCGPDAVRTTLPQPPAPGEPFDASLPPPPDDPAALTAWARSLSELTEARLLEAEARGEARGEAKGKAEGLRAAVLDLCEVLGIEVTDEQRAQLDAMGVGELEALRQALKTTRRWPGPGP